VGVKVDYSRLKKFARDIGKLADAQRDVFFQEAARDLAELLLALVIPRTPVSNGQKDAEGRTIGQGGTLRRAWSTANAMLNVVKVGDEYQVTVINPTEYASYVEYGHRQTPGRYVPAIGKRLVKSWVEGAHMLEISEKELKQTSPALLQRKLDRFLRQVF